MTIRRTASMARVLWYGSIVAGGITGGIGAVLLTYHLMFSDERRTA